MLGLDHHDGTARIQLAHQRIRRRQRIGGGAGRAHGGTLSAAGTDIGVDGDMIAGGRELIVAAPWVAIAPGIALVITVLACTLLGDALRDRLAGEPAAAVALRDRT